MITDQYFQMIREKAEAECRREDREEKVIRHVFASLVDAINANTQAMLELAESNYAIAATQAEHIDDEIPGEL